MRKEDFTFIEKEPSGWWWFEVHGETKKKISDTIHEQGFVTVTEVGYNILNGEMFVLKQFIFSKNYDCYENNELKELLREMCK